MEKKNIDWLTDIHDSLNELGYVARRLEELSYSFYVVGNESVGKTLGNFVNIIEDNAKKINQATGKSISEGLKRSQEMSGTILQATLAGCLMSKQND